MPHTKGDGSSKEREVIIKGMTPLSGGGYVPRRDPARADFTKWARRDTWHITEAVMLLLGFEPFDFKAFSWPKPEGFDDIYDTATRSIGAGTLRATPIHYGRPRDFLAWAHEKEYRVPRRLEALVNRFHAKDEGTPQAGAENNDLTPLKPQTETPVERSARLVARHQELKAGGNRHPTKTLAEEVGISPTRVREVMKLTRS